MSEEYMGKKMLIRLAFIVSLSMVAFNGVSAQEQLPADNGIATYHTSPRYRESESHPLRILAYVVHPIGWVFREVIFRPFSYFASSTEITRSVFGYREPFDYRQPECFSADDSVPDCRSITPFNYDTAGEGLGDESSDVASINGEPTIGTGKEVYFPNVNFDFDSRKLNQLGQGKAKQIAEMLKREPGVKVVLQGHTDFVGSEEYNLKLGTDRAEAVRQELIALGVAAESLSTVTFGESQPLFNEQEDWARALNRRVEAHKDAQ